MRGAQEEVGAGLLVHQQVEVAAAVALLDVGQAVEGVGQRRADRGEQLEPVDCSDGSPRRDIVGWPMTPTMSPRWTSTSPPRSAEQRSWIRPQRSTRSRKTSFPRSRRASTRPASRRSLAPRRPARAARPRRGRPRSRRGRGSASGVIAASLDAGVSPHHPGLRAACRASGPRARPRSRGARRSEVRLGVREQRARDAVAPEASMPGCRSALPIPSRRLGGSTPMPARYQCGSGTAAARIASTARP